MSRYIDADLMREKAYQMNFGGRISERELFLFNRALSEMPTVDAVPVVRCGECKHRKPPTDYCEKLCKAYVPDYFYCKYGERKDGETEQCNTYSLGKIEMPNGAMKKIIADGERKDGDR